MLVAEKDVFCSFCFLIFIVSFKWCIKLYIMCYWDISWTTLSSIIPSVWSKHLGKAYQRFSKANGAWYRKHIFLIVAPRGIDMLFSHSVKKSIFFFKKCTFKTQNVGSHLSLFCLACWIDFCLAFIFLSKVLTTCEKVTSQLNSSCNSYMDMLFSLQQRGIGLFLSSSGVFSCEQPWNLRWSLRPNSYDLLFFHTGQSRG